jgi:CRISPR/Cas system-associated exonuclease Cas4 (RecB family)
VAELSPAQQDVLDQLGATPGTRPDFDAELRYELRGEIEKGIADHVQLLGADDTVFANKHALSAVHGCETKYLAEMEFPGWSVPLARGTIVHKAIELSINWRGAPDPADLVDEALGTLEHSEQHIAGFLQELSEADRAQLRSDVVGHVTAFTECWPPLEKRWRPVTESKVRLELFDGQVVLQGKIDLTLGRANGLQAGKVLVDLKSGKLRAAHLDDLRYYALIETVRIGVPPRRLASYYLDQGRFHPEDVNEDLLFAAAGRAVNGIRRMIELQVENRTPSLVAGPQCRWCSIRDTCETGQRHLNEFDDPLEDLA